MRLKKRCLKNTQLEEKKKKKSNVRWQEKKQIFELLGFKKDLQMPKG